MSGQNTHGERAQEAGVRFIQRENHGVFVGRSNSHAPEGGGIHTLIGRVLDGFVGENNVLGCHRLPIVEAGVGAQHGCDGLAVFAHFNGLRQVRHNVAFRQNARQAAVHEPGQIQINIVGAGIERVHVIGHAHQPFNIFATTGWQRNHMELPQAHAHDTQAKQHHPAQR